MPVRGITDEEMFADGASVVFEQRFDSGAFYADARILVDPRPCELPFLATIGRRGKSSIVSRHPDKGAAMRGLSELVLRHYGARRVFG